MDEESKKKRVRDRVAVLKLRSDRKSDQAIDQGKAKKGFGGFTDTLEGHDGR